MSSTKSSLYGERLISNAQMLCFDNPNPERVYEISIELPEFTCKCPFSGYPDFATIRIFYQPKDKVVELKSIKLYINNFRDKQISHEEVANQIMDDFVNSAQPRWIQLEADFNPRGNIHTIIRLCDGERTKLDLVSGNKFNNSREIIC